MAQQELFIITYKDMYKSLLAMAMMFSSIYDPDKEKWKEQILAEWDKSKEYPRKKKKKVRKSLRIDWTLINSTY